MKIPGTSKLKRDFDFIPLTEVLLKRLHLNKANFVNV